MSSPSSECVCESCSAEVIGNVNIMPDPPGYLASRIRERSLAHIAAVEFFPSAAAGPLVSAGVVHALLDIVSAHSPRAQPTRTVYCAVRGACRTIHELPDDGPTWHCARAHFAERIAAFLRECSGARLRGDQHAFAGIMCCTLDALFAHDRKVELDLIDGQRLLRLNPACARVREEVLLKDEFPSQFVFQSLFQVITKPRLYCQAEKELHVDNTCIHNRSISVLCKLLLNLDERHRVAARRIILREVPSALSTLMGIVRDSTVPNDVLGHSLYILYELLKCDEGAKTSTIAELLRLAPDAVSVFIEALFHVDNVALPALLDTLYLTCTYILSKPETSRDMERRSPFRIMSSWLYENQTGLHISRIAACLILRSLATSTETKFVGKHLKECARCIRSSGALARRPPRTDYGLVNSPYHVACEVLEHSRIVEGNPDPDTSAFVWKEHLRLAAKWRQHICEHCGLPDDKVQKLHAYCKGCKKAHFCTQQHHNAAWRLGHHKSLCAAYRRLAQEEAGSGTATHAVGDDSKPLESNAAVEEYIGELTDRAARAGVPSACVLFVVDKPASTAMERVQQRSEKMPSSEYEKTAGRTRISWMSPCDWVGMHTSRMMSFEMDPVKYPSLLHRYAELAIEEHWMEYNRQSWWRFEADRESESDSESDSEESYVEDEDDDSDFCDDGSPLDDNHISEIYGRKARREGRKNPSSMFYESCRREYRVAWWEWTDSGYRVVRYSHSRMSDGIPTPKLFRRNCN